MRDTLTCLEKCIQGFTTVLTHLVHLIEQLDEAGKELGSEALTLKQELEVVACQTV